MELLHFVRSANQNKEVATTGKIRITKSISGFTFLTPQSSNVNLPSLKNALVNLVVERKGKNVQIASDLPFCDFLMLGCDYGEEITNLSTGQAISVNLTQDEGNLNLEENEAIILEISDLPDTVNLRIYGDESWVMSLLPIEYERKTISGDTIEAVFNVIDYDHMSVQMHNDIKEIDLHFANGVVNSLHPNQFRNICAPNGLYAPGSSNNTEAMFGRLGMLLSLEEDSLITKVVFKKVRNPLNALDICFTKR